MHYYITKSKKHIGTFFKIQQGKIPSQLQERQVREKLTTNLSRNATGSHRDRALKASPQRCSFLLQESRLLHQWASTQKQATKHSKKEQSATYRYFKIRLNR